MHSQMTMSFEYFKLLSDVEDLVLKFRRNRLLGTDSWASLTFINTGSVILSDPLYVAYTLLGIHHNSVA